MWWDPGVEVTNGIELSKETPEEVRLGQCYCTARPILTPHIDVSQEAFWLEFPEHGILAYTQRCLGSIAVPLDLHNFPFVRHFDHNVCLLMNVQ